MVEVGGDVFVGSGCGSAGHPLGSSFGLALLLRVVRVVLLVTLAVVRLCVVVVLLVEVGGVINGSAPQLPTVGICFGACSWVLLRGVLRDILRVV